MTYALIKDNTVIEYPVFEGEIKLRFPNTSFSIPFFPPDEYQLVKDIPIPSVTYEQNVTEGTPQLVDGVWTKIWIITDANEEEILFRTENKAQSVRIQRNSLLFQSDWTQTKDASVNSDLWQVYRQNLRDIPNQIGFPWEVEWPSKPS